MHFPWIYFQSLYQLPTWRGNTAVDSSNQGSIDILTHSIIDHLNASGIIAASTTNFTNVNGTQFIKTFIDLDTWQLAAAAVAEKNPNLPIVADTPPALPQAGTTADDTYVFTIACDGDFLNWPGNPRWFVETLMRFAYGFQEDIIIQAQPGWFRYNLQAPDNASISLTYTVSIWEWVDEFGGDFIYKMYKDMMGFRCISRGEVKGGINTAMDITRGMVEISTEVYAGWL